jgi:DNA repair protein RecN (Recombination protein N)
MEFTGGFNVITGETGAGKTIIMQAISLLLGERAPKELIRDGTDTCEISAEITAAAADTKAVKLLSSLGIPLENNEQIIIRRVITASSSRNYINDRPVSLQGLKLLGDLLIDTHGPHEHQSILKQNVQLSLLDSYAGLEKETQKSELLYRKMRDACEAKENFEKDIPDSKQEEFLRHLLSEIKNAAPGENEENELSTKHKLLSNSQSVLETAAIITGILSDSEDSILEKIYSLNKNLISIEKLDPDGIAPFMKESSEIASKTSSLSEKIRDYASKMELDEKEFSAIEERLRIINALKRKYGPEIADVLKTADESGKKLALIADSANIREKLAQALKSAEAEFLSQCSELSAERKAASAKFAKKVFYELGKLGFHRSIFRVDFSAAEPGPSGSDKVDFMFSANPGEEAKPLRNVASSGEISRAMLALKTVLAEADSVPILVFDEIDSNIGGTTASTVGEKLANLAKNHQLICISHLAQVASFAEHHFVVEKNVKADRTFTNIRKVEGKDRIAEIARMLGGTEAAGKHAKEIMRAQT